MPMFSSNAKEIEFAMSENRSQLTSFMTQMADYLNAGLFTTFGTSYNGYTYSLGDYAFAIAKAEFASNSSDVGAKMAPLPYANSNQKYYRTHGLSGFTMFKTGRPYAAKGAWLFAKELLSEFATQEPLSRLAVPAMTYSTEPTGNTYIDNMTSVASSVKNCYIPMPKVNNISNILDEFDSILRNIKNGRSVPQAVEYLVNNVLRGL